MFCPNCNAEYEGKINFCKNCGFKLPENVEIVEVLVNNEPIENIQPEVYTEPQMEVAPQVYAENQMYAEPQMEVAPQVYTENQMYAEPQMEVAPQVYAENQMYAEPQMEVAPQVYVENPIQGQAPVILTKRKKEFSLGRKILNGGVSAILIVFLLVFTVTSSITLISREIIKPKNVSEVVDTFSPLDIPVNEFGVEVRGNDTVEEYCVDYFKISKREVKKVYENSTLQTYVGDKINEFVEDFKDGELEITIEKDEMERLLKQNIGVIESETNQELSQYQLDFAYNQIDKIKEINISIPQEIGEIEIGDGLSFILSDAFLYIQLGIVLLLAVCIGLMNWSVSKAMICSAPVFIVVGLAVIAFSILISTNFAMFGIESQLIEVIAMDVYNISSEYFNGVGICTALIGVVFLTIGILINKLSVKK